MVKFEYVEHDKVGRSLHTNTSSTNSIRRYYNHMRTTTTPCSNNMATHQDPLYGIIELPLIVQAIIENRYFQRLRKVKQLGFLCIRYPSATITRYDHCIGVYHAATLMLCALESNSTPEARTKTFDRTDWPLHRLAVQLAALLHDIGHGPFSHTWEEVCGHQYSHEDVGSVCVDRIFASASFAKPEFEVLFRDGGYLIDLIKALIVGDKENVPNLPAQFGFIFEIVNNKVNKADVDKWDYLKRDCNAFEADLPEEIKDDAWRDIDDVFLNARVSNDGAHITYHYKDARKFYRIFELRDKMWLVFYRAFQNRCRDRMFVSMIAGCKDAALINGKDITTIRPDDEEFFQLTDVVALDVVKQHEWYGVILSADDIEPATQIALDAQREINAHSKLMPKLERSYFHGELSDLPSSCVLEGEFVVLADSADN